MLTKSSSEISIYFEISERVRIRMIYVKNFCCDPDILESKWVNQTYKNWTNIKRFYE